MMRDKPLYSKLACFLLLLLLFTSSINAYFLDEVLQRSPTNLFDFQFGAAVAANQAITRIAAFANSVVGQTAIYTFTCPTYGSGCTVAARLQVASANFNTWPWSPAMCMTADGSRLHIGLPNTGTTQILSFQWNTDNWIFVGATNREATYTFWPGSITCRLNTQILVGGILQSTNRVRYTLFESAFGYNFVSTGLVLPTDFASYTYSFIAADTDASGIVYSAPYNNDYVIFMNAVSGTLQYTLNNYNGWGASGYTIAGNGQTWAFPSIWDYNIRFGVAYPTNNFGLGSFYDATPPAGAAPTGMRTIYTCGTGSGMVMFVVGAGADTQGLGRIWRRDACNIGGIPNSCTYTFQENIVPLYPVISLMGSTPTSTRLISPEGQRGVFCGPGPGSSISVETGGYCMLLSSLNACTGVDPAPPPVAPPVPPPVPPPITPPTPPPVAPPVLPPIPAPIVPPPVAPPVIPPPVEPPVVPPPVAPPVVPPPVEPPVVPPPTEPPVTLPPVDPPVEAPVNAPIEPPVDPPLPPPAAFPPVTMPPVTTPTTPATPSPPTPSPPTSDLTAVWILIGLIGLVLLTMLLICCCRGGAWGAWRRRRYEDRDFRLQQQQQQQPQMQRNAPNVARAARRQLIPKRM